MLDRYTAITLPSVDAHVAAALCIGGAVKYEPIKGSGVADHWLVNDFVPHLSAKLGNRAALFLSKALLWCLNEPTTMYLIPQSLRARLRTRYERIRTLDEVINPIEKIPILIYSTGGSLEIDPTVRRNQTAEGETSAPESRK